MDKKDSFLFKKLFRNGIFNIIYKLQDLEELYIYLIGEDKINLVDRYGIVYSQIEIVKKDVKTLQELIDRNVSKDFYIKE